MNPVHYQIYIIPYANNGIIYIELESKIQRARLRWFGNVERKEENDWVKTCTRMNVTGVVGRGARRKTWSCVEMDMKAMGIQGGNSAGPLCLEEYYWGGGGPTRASADV